MFIHELLSKAAEAVKEYMPDEVAFYHFGQDEPHFKTQARIQPRRNVAQRDTNRDVIQQQSVQFQMPLEAAKQDIRVDDEVRILQCDLNPSLVGMWGTVNDTFNASFNIEFTVSAVFDLQAEKYEHSGLEEPPPTP